MESLLTTATANIAYENALRNMKTLQDHVIGLFRYHTSDEWEPVIAYKERMVTTVRINSLLGVSKSISPEVMGDLKLFPGNKTMTQMLGDVNEWSKFYNSL